MVLSERLTLIGYWRENESDLRWPDASSFVDGSWNAEDRDFVARYLELATVVRAFGGVSRCRLCGNANGALELTDGVYVWPDGLAHYVRVHSVRLPEEFVEHALALSDRISEMPVDAGWWQSQAIGETTE